MRKYLFAALGLVGLSLAGTAQAAPALSINVYEDNVLVGALSATSGTGTLHVAGATPNFIIASGDAAGTPFIPQPGMFAQSLSVSSAAGFVGPHTLRIEVSQTGMTSATAGGLLAQLASTFTANMNNQNPNSISSVTLNNYVDNNDLAFGKTTLIGSQVFSGSGAQASGPTPASFSLTNALFSETMVMSATFLTGSAGLATSSALTSVPEPASLALLGSALLGFGFIRRNRRS